MVRTGVWPSGWSRIRAELEAWSELGARTEPKGRVGVVVRRQARDGSPEEGKAKGWRRSKPGLEVGPVQDADPAQLLAWSTLSRHCGAVATRLKW